MLRKSELKKIIILALIILIISIISIITINKIQYKKYTNMVNNRGIFEFYDRKIGNGN